MSAVAEIASHVAALASPSPTARLEARKSLVELGAPAVPLLIEALAGAESILRWEAAKALVEIADPSAASALVRTLNDESSGVRWLAAEALIALGSAALVPTLEGLLMYSNLTRFRQGARHVLCRCCRCDGVALGFIQPVLDALSGMVPDLAAPVAASRALDALKTGVPSETTSDAHAMTEESPAPRSDLPEKPAPSILLAEDNDDMRGLLALLLRKEGCAVTECRHGVELLDRLGSSVLGEDPTQAYDLIISDIRMPGVSGLTILEGLSGRRGFPPIILITAFGDAETHRHARLCGAARVLDKPFDTDELLAAVREVLSRRPTSSDTP